jgi:hypothetical protein
MIKLRKMGWEGSVAHKGRVGMHTLFWWETLKDLRVGGRIKLNWILEILDGSGVGWINIAQDRVQWKALVNTVTNLQVP